ncbi:MAG: type I DNA topoisomerase [Candidatus Abyssobacteria bacterium SURF_5]|uniref:DNA topoisomerase 1 n=1 Tax=Abyssobacteria bacterium (strain SURF_5) TaxID=2093360 RepID=A0A3A4N707_ABYX5|nr:MAG: type I DNA topoisomerase [Candidatus Abyssubacteria bacterium SURF_5]
MAKKLLVVESPAKAKTINKYLGKEYHVEASMGHVRDLPEKELGVDVDGNFRPKYTILSGKKKIVSRLKKEAQDAEIIYLAPDFDREGEAIGWHIQEALGSQANKKMKRIVFNEITRNAVQEAIRHPRDIDMALVNAQQARRILDRLVGYKISPLLWDKVKRGLSAGRVQSVAVRLLCEREEQINKFVPQEYWSIKALLQKAGYSPFEALLAKIEGEKAEVANGEEASRIAGELRKASYVVKNLETKEVRRRPYPPFITSTLQQEASKKLRMRPTRTMRLAQELYEGVEIPGEGNVALITYMRTDSVRISKEAQDEALNYILARYGREYYPPNHVNVFKNKRDSQDAHEAVRPTSMEWTPERLAQHLPKEYLQLYTLIWNRFLASQMAPAIYDQTTIEIEAAAKYLLRASGSILRSKGFLVLYKEESEDNGNGEERETSFPPVVENDALELKDVQPEQHFTKPPPRFTEATLVKALEEQGIGRPSTYATIVDTIQKRKYVHRERGRLSPTDLGCTVNDLLVESFPKILDIEFTAKMEEQLDEVEEGKIDWQQVLWEFYRPFEDSLATASQKMRDVKKDGVPTEETCENCGKPMVLRWGRYGKFLACSGYPECKTTKKVAEEGSAGSQEEAQQLVSGKTCPNCGGQLVVKMGRMGRFVSCSNYPECKTAMPLSIGVACPEPGCGGEVVERRSKRGRVFYSCSRYPDCKFASWNKPVAKACPLCGGNYLVEQYTRDGKHLFKCPRKGCSYKEDVKTEAAL